MFARILSLLAAAVLMWAGLGGVAEAKWLRAESAKFIVYSNGDEGSLREFVTNLEDYDVILRAFTSVPIGAPAPRKLEIYLIRDSDELKVIRPEFPNTVGGFYSASMNDIFAVAIRPRAQEYWRDDIIYHEYAHHFMLQYLPGSYPGWLVEGFAEYFATVELRDTSFIIGKPSPARGTSLLSGRWIPMEEVFTKRPLELKGSEERSAYYAQAWLLTHYMMSDPVRRKQIFAYVSALSPTVGPIEAWKKATGQDMETLTRELQSYRRGTIGATGFNRPSKRQPAAMTITTLGPSADDLMLLGLNLNGGVSSEGEAKALETIRTRAAKFPNDPLAQTILARAEFAFGDFDKGRAIVEAMMASRPDDATPYRLLGMALVSKARDDGDNEEKLLAEASRQLAKAYERDPTDYRILIYFALTQQTKPGYPDDATMEALAEAFRLAPQVAETRVYLARGLMRQKRWDEAILVLTPLANSPHGGGGAETARNMLRQIEANRG